MIFDRFFGKKENKSNATTSITLQFSDLPVWALEQKRMITADSLEMSKQHIEAVENAIKDLRENIEQFESQEIEEDIVKRLESITLTSKAKYCEIMKKILDDHNIVLPKDIEGLSAYIDSIQDLLRMIEKAHAQHGKYLGITFQSNLKMIGQDVKSIMDPLYKLSVIEDEHRPKYNAATKTLQQLEDLESNITTKEDIDNLEKKKTSIEQELSDANKKIIDYKASKEYINYNHLIEKIHTIDSEKKELNARLYDELAPIKRVLKKYQKALDESKVTGVSSQKVNEYIEHPVIALQNDSQSLDSLSKIVSGAIDAIENGTITEKKGKVSKLLEIKEMIPGPLSEEKYTYDKLCSSLDEEKKKMELFDTSTLTALERDIKDNTSSLHTINQNIEDSKASIQMEKERKMAKKRHIIEKIEKIWDNVTVNL